MLHTAHVILRALSKILADDILLFCWFFFQRKLEFLVSPRSRDRSYVCCIHSVYFRFLSSIFCALVDQFHRLCNTLIWSVHNTGAMVENLWCSELADGTCLDLSTLSIMQHLQCLVLLNQQVPVVSSVYRRHCGWARTRKLHIINSI